MHWNFMQDEYPSLFLYTCINSSYVTKICEKCLSGLCVTLSFRSGCHCENFEQPGTLAAISQFRVVVLYAEPLLQDPILTDPSFRHIMNKKQLPGYGCREWSPNGKGLFAGQLKPETRRTTNNTRQLSQFIVPYG